MYYVPHPLREDDHNKKWVNKYRYCEDKWLPRHRCNNKKIYTCEAEKESITSSSDSDGCKEKNDVPNTELEEDLPKISLAALTGIAQQQTLKLRGHVKKDNVTILLDPWSTHNSIDITIAKRLNLFVYPVADIRVKVADGKGMDGVEKCHKVKLQIEVYELEFGFYTVPLEGVDIVLRVQWLQTLGTYLANHQKQFIKFKWGGRKYKLYGFQPPPPKLYFLDKWRN
jgi:hypothetical protein